MEILQDIIGGLILICVLVAISWTFIIKLLNGKKNKRALAVLNIVLFVLYMNYFIYGRMNWSQYGNALVWEFYATITPTIHTILLLIVVLVMKKVERH